VTTAEALEAMTDAGEFEVLATRVLRIEDEDCRLLEHMGVNAAGKTIPNPIDSFCLVPGSEPPRFVMAAFTTVKAESLRSKWLFDHSHRPQANGASPAEDGDLTKAASRAHALRTDHPDASFIVHLCTNKRIDDELMAEVYKQAGALGVEVRFLAQSRIRDSLDTKPEGQWLRKEHLGIEAELLSVALLRQLSRESVRRFGQEFLFTPPERFARTSAQGVVEQESQKAARSVIIVSGASGSGKSVAAYLALREHVSGGGVGLWVPGEAAANSASLQDAIGETLRSLHPTVEAGAGRKALALGGPSKQLLVVVDDVNRSGQPTATLRKILGWGRPTAADGEGEGAGSPLTIVVPAWDAFWAPLKPLFRDCSWVSQLPLGRMDEADAVSCLEAAMGARAKRFSLPHRHQLATALGCAPILIAMFARLEEAASPDDPLTLAQEAMQRYVESAVAEAAVRKRTLAHEHMTALHELVRWMLLNREFYPDWARLTQFFPRDRLVTLEHLAALGVLCRVTEQSRGERFEFRHDRILEHLAAQVLRSMLEEPEAHADVLSDPYYASFVGRALTSDRCPCSDDTVDWVCARSPLALVAAIRFLAGAAQHADKIVGRVRRWLASATADESAPPVLLYEAHRVLEEIDSPIVLEVTESLPPTRPLSLARLANGDAAAIAIELADSRWFAPSVTDPALDAILARAFHSHRQRLIHDCRDLLHSREPDEGMRRGALILAGFIGEPSLCEPIRVAWDSASDKPAVLVPALWAGLRCGARAPGTVLDPTISEWSCLSDEPRDGLRSDRLAIAEGLRLGVPRGIPEPVLRYLIDQARSTQALRLAITYMLQGVDHPVAVKFLIHEAAEIEAQAKETGGFSPWVMMLRDQWDPTRPTLGSRLSPASLAAIRSCWESPDSDQPLRGTALRFWARATEDLSALGSISQDRPGLESVLWRRAKLGDLTVVPLVKPLLARNNDWFHVLPPIWCGEFVEATGRALLALRADTPADHSGGTSDDHYFLAHLLRDIPTKDAEPLLVTHWDYLQYSRLFVQVALYLATPQCLEFASTAIEEYPADADVFEHVSSLFGFGTQGLSDRVTVRHLEVLLPYLSQLHDQAICDMTEYCQRHDLHAWADTHLKPEVDRRRAQLPETVPEKREYVERLGRHLLPSDGDLLDELNCFESQKLYRGHVWHWCKEFERRGDAPERWKRILVNWLGQSPMVERYTIIAQVLLQLGSRSDLDLLTRYAIAGDQDEVARIAANARFGVMRRTLK